VKKKSTENEKGKKKKERKKNEKRDPTRSALLGRPTPASRGEGGGVLLL
jgi:hypothetical protein